MFPRFSTGIAVSAALAAVSASPTTAQSVPTSIPAVISICAPVISEEYDGNHQRWGTCIAAVDEFTAFIGAPSLSADPILADLVVALAELFQELDECDPEQTELPAAIALAAQRTLDEELQVRIQEISFTIRDCTVFATAAISAPFGAIAPVGGEGGGAPGGGPGQQASPN